MTSPTTHQEREGKPAGLVSDAPKPSTGTALGFRLLLAALVLLGSASCNDRRGVGDDLREAPERQGFGLVLTMLVVCILAICVVSCNARRGLSENVRSGHADAGPTLPIEDASEGESDALDVIGVVDVLPADVEPVDTVTEDVVADADEDAPEAAADAAPDADADASPSDVSEHEECRPGARVVYEELVTIPVDSRRSDRPGFSALGRVDVDGDGVDELFSYGRATLRRVFRPGEEGPDVQPVEDADRWVRDLGLLRDRATGEDVATAVASSENVVRIFAMRVVGDAIELSELPASDPFFALDSPFEYADGRLFTERDGEISEVTLHGGELDLTLCGSGDYRGLTYDPRAGRLWTWLVASETELSFVSLDPDDCGSEGEVSEPFEGIPYVEPLVAHHDDGRTAIVHVDDERVTQLVDGTLSYWEIGMPQWFFVYENAAEQILRLAGTVSDVIISQYTQLDPFRQRAAFALEKAPAMRVSENVYLSALGVDLLWRDSVNPPTAAPLILPISPANTAQWWRPLEGSPGVAARDSWVPEGPELSQIVRYQAPYAASIAPRPLPIGDSLSPNGLPGLDLSPEMTDIEGAIQLSEFRVWRTRTDRPLTEHDAAPDSDTPLSFGEVWASGVSNGGLRDAVYYARNIRSLGSATYRRDLPRGVVWAIGGERGVETGRGEVVLTHVRVLRDAVSDARWYLIGNSDDGLHWYEMDVARRALTPLVSFGDSGIDLPTFVEPVGSLSTGLLAVGDGQQLVFMQVQDGVPRTLGAERLPAGFTYSRDSFGIQQTWANGPDGGTLTDLEGNVWAVLPDASIERLEGLPPAQSASRGDFDGDGKVDVLVQPADDQLVGEFRSILFFGVCEPL